MDRNDNALNVEDKIKVNKTRLGCGIAFPQKGNSRIWLTFEPVGWGDNYADIIVTNHPFGESSFKCAVRLTPEEYPIIIDRLKMVTEMFETLLEKQNES
jgi:hypothetical protein